MYFSMDELGFENTERVKQIASETEKWRFIYDIAKAYGFEGVHFTPSLYDEFGLSLENIPKYFQEFRLTLHAGGLFSLSLQHDTSEIDTYLARCFDVAVKHGMHDISVHPAVTHGLTVEKKQVSYANFERTIATWLAKAQELGITFSLETHVTGDYFLFDGLAEYVEFIAKHPGLGVLIDISHNFFDGFTEDEIIGFFGDKNVTGIHISDALRRVDASFKEGTHLPVGKGAMDVARIVQHFKSINNVCGVLEIKCENEDLGESLEKLREMV